MLFISQICILMLTKLKDWGNKSSDKMKFLSVTSVGAAAG